MADPLTPSKGLTLPSLGGDFGLWGQLLNNNLSLIDSAAGGTLFLAVTGNSILTSVQTQSTGYKFTGSLSGNSTITWPAFSGLAAIENSTLGGYAIICGVSGGSTVSISGGTTLSVWSDGANFLPLTLFPGGGSTTTTGSGALVLQVMPTIITPNVSGFLTLQGTVSGASVLTAPVSGGGTIFFPGGNKTLAANDLSNVTLTGDVSNTNAAITVTNLSHVTNNSLAPAGLASGYVTLGSTQLNIGAAIGTSGVSGLSVLNSTLVSGTSGNFQTLTIAGTATVAVVSGARRPVLTPSSSYQLLTTDSNSCFTNLTSGLYVLPASGVAVIGTFYTFAVVTSGNTLLVSGGSSIKIALGTTVSVSGLISSNSPYSSLSLLCVSGNLWIADRATGAWIVT